MSRILTFIYGLVCYAVSVAALLYAIGFIGGFLTPTSLDGSPSVPAGRAMAIDLALLAAFAVQHSGMARPAFKRWWTRFVPVAIERSTYLLVSSLAMLAFFVAWEPIGGVVWSVAGGLPRTLILSLYGFGWALLLYSTFLIDHFDLFGLRQVWNSLIDQPHREPRFRAPTLYKVVRHPLYVGWLTILWCAPTMTLAHLVFAMGTTAYILLAIRWEERDLVAAHGQVYAEYRRRTPMLIPRLRPRRKASVIDAPLVDS